MEVGNRHIEAFEDIEEEDTVTSFVKHDYSIMHAINVLLECIYLLSTSTYSSRFFSYLLSTF